MDENSAWVSTSWQVAVINRSITLAESRVDGGVAGIRAWVCAVAWETLGWETAMGDNKMLRIARS